MIENVAVVVYDGVAPFELGVLCEAWATDRSDQGLPTFDFAVCAPQAGPVTTAAAEPERAKPTAISSESSEQCAPATVG